MTPVEFFLLGSWWSVLYYMVGLGFAWKAADELPKETWQAPLIAVLILIVVTLVWPSIIVTESIVRYEKASKKKDS